MMEKGEGFSFASRKPGAHDEELERDGSRGRKIWWVIFGVLASTHTPSPRVNLQGLGHFWRQARQSGSVLGGTG